VHNSVPVHRAESVAGPYRASVIVTCVHGTWARGSRWPGVEQAVAEALAGCGAVHFQYFEWSGRNSAKARARAADDLRRVLVGQLERIPLARHVLIAHSHGANIVLHALDGKADGHAIRSALGGVILLAPPLLDCELVDRPAAAANRLLLGAITMIPLLVAASRHAQAALSLGQLGQLAGLALALGLWLMPFRPHSVRRRAEALARQLALPRLDLPGLVVRAPRDEATFALASVSFFARIARHAWARVLHVRTPFRRRDAQRLDDARGVRQLARALFEAVILVPVSLTLASQLRQAAIVSEWFTAAMLIPLTVMLVTAAIAIVGGAMMLLLLLPAFSILLWPFGILPTPAAALLNVSVTDVPAAAWRVIYIANRFGGWRHCVHQHAAALECVNEYVRHMVAGVYGPDRIAPRA